MKIVANESFGYRTITVEQPLRGRYVLDSAAWAELPEDNAFAKLDDETRRRLARAMFELGNGEVESEVVLRRSIIGMAEDMRIPKPTASVLKALVARCLVRDPEAPVIRDAKDAVVPDPARRDTENVPLDEDVDSYLDREVRPHAPGAWCPDPQGKIGYEIPFTRLFYRYTPPRPSAEIKKELEQLEREIHRLLASVVA